MAVGYREYADTPSLRTGERMEVKIGYAYRVDAQRNGLAGGLLASDTLNVNLVL